MNGWRWRARDGGGGRGAHPAGCPHCRRPLRVCPACGGRYDTGRLCQRCMFGVVCPACQRHWTWN